MRLVQVALGSCRCRQRALETATSWYLGSCERLFETRQHESKRRPGDPRKHEDENCTVARRRKLTPIRAGRVLAAVAASNVASEAASPDAPKPLGGTDEDADMIDADRKRTEQSCTLMTAEREKARANHGGTDELGGRTVFDNNRRPPCPCPGHLRVDRPRVARAGCHIACE